MKFKFNIQPYQTKAVESVVKVFDGQPFYDGFTYRIDAAEFSLNQLSFNNFIGYANNKIALSHEQILNNINKIQAENNIKLDEKLDNISLDVEMETGTGKTYVYIKTMFELNIKYGWSKFIVVVPSIAIREGVYKSFEITQEHFMEQYHKKARYFVYNSKNLNAIDSFSQSNDINIMIINIQAFNARGEAARRIKTELDSFGSRRPIDIIKANKPIIILDEPQKMGGQATQESLKDFNPLFYLNYSATHKQHHTLVYALDALDAYNNKLVKKIEVKGFDVQNLTGADSYLYLDEIIISPDKPPRARLELEVKYNKEIKRVTRIINFKDDLFALSNNLEQYRGFTVSEINSVNKSVEFTNGIIIHAGEASGDVSELDMRRLQIRETIRSHLQKEKELFNKGIKCLSLFFIDEVAKYRKYDEEGREINSEYGEIFEQEYNFVLNEQRNMFNEAYNKYLSGIETHKTHAGYFSIDKKGRKINSVLKRGSDASDDIAAYELILKDKERLLSLDNPVRFIFSHSALREGWDNPNVFQICTLKHGGSSAINKRQEVGRGLRLCVDQNGTRMDAETLGDEVFKINKLTVIASEGYKTFVESLQSAIKEDLSERSANALPDDFVENGRKPKITNKLNNNFNKPEFKALWDLIKNKYAYKVEFDDEKLIKNAVISLDANLRDKVPQLNYTLTIGEQQGLLKFEEKDNKTNKLEQIAGGSVKYDLIGKIAQAAKLTRRTAAKILAAVRPDTFAKFKLNPEKFINEAVMLINNVKAELIAENIKYIKTNQVYDADEIFKAESGELDRAYKADKNIHDYVLPDSGIELRMAQDMDKASEVCVYAKLPKGYAVSTPVGNYSPDWAAALKDNKYIIAETKGSTDEMQLRLIERIKLKCAEKLFAENNAVIYRVVDGWQSLLNSL